MAIAIAGTNGVFFIDDDGTKREIILRVVPSHGDNLVEVVVLDGEGAELGTPYRLNMSDSGSRLAGSLPGVNAAYFIVDENNQITNG